MVYSKSTYSDTSSKMNGVLKKKEAMLPFYLVVLYLLLEFGRPQTFVPILRNLHLPAITLILMLISVLFSAKLYLKDKQTILFILLIAEMVIHGPIALNNYWAFTIFYTTIVTFIGYIGIICIVDKDYKYDKLIKFWLIIFIYLGIVGVMRKGVGVGGFIGDENDFCMSLNMVLPFAFFGILSEKKIINKMYFIFIACLLLSAILTYSRGGFIGLVTVTIYCWIRSNKKITFAMIIGFFVIFALLTAPASYWERIRSISDEAQNTDRQAGTGSQRVYSWKLGWDIFLENPIIGVGQGNYPWHVGESEDKKGLLWKTRSISGRAAHSLYFTLLPELGIIGTILFFTMIFYSINDLKYIKNASNIYRGNILTEEEARKTYYQALALEGGLIGFLVTSVFISTLYYPNFWILCGFILSLKKIVYTKCGDLRTTTK